MLDRIKDWAAERVFRAAVGKRQRAAMGKREWWSGVAGMNSVGFAGAAINRLTASLAQSSGSINHDLDGNLVVLRARARALAANNENARRFLSMVGVNVVGPCGPTLQVRAKLINGALDKPANDAIEMAWARWSCDAEVSGRMDLAHAMRVSAQAVARDGETLIRFVRNKALPMGIQVQVLEADRLDEAMNRTLGNGNRVRQGVELDSMLRPVAYWLKAAHPGESWQAVAPAVERVNARDILHVFRPDRAEQVRGYTWFHAVLLRLAMLHAYEEAAVIAARVGASKMGIFQRKDAATPSLLDSMADAKDSAGRLQMSAEPGEFMEAPPGYELSNWDPEYPHANFESFLKQCMRGVAAGLDVAAHNLSGDMTDVNYSSARIAELGERDQWCVLQEWWNRAVMLPIYREWLASALLRNEVTFEQSGKALPADKLDKFISAARFQSRRWQWVDPAKEVEAAERLIASGLSSRTAIAASQGREVEDIIDELKQEKQLLEAAGLPTKVGNVAGTPKVSADAPDAPAKGARQTVNFEEGAFKIEVRAGDTSVNIPEREVKVENSVTVPEREINLEALIDVPAAQVVVAHPKKTVETIERDGDKEIARIVREHKD